MCVLHIDIHYMVPSLHIIFVYHLIEWTDSRRVDMGLSETILLEFILAQSFTWNDLIKQTRYERTQNLKGNESLHHAANTSSKNILR